MCENTAAIQFAKDPKFYGKTKHIKKRYHFVWDANKGKEVAIKYITTSKMIADPLTKPICRDAFKTQVIILGLRRLQFLGMFDDCIMNIFYSEFPWNKELIFLFTCS